MMCQWFALCTNDAHGTVRHPILGNVPTCDRCARKLELTVDYPEGLASCDNCGFIDHDDNQLDECVGSMLAQPTQGEEE